MPLILRQTIKPAGTFPAVEAADVLMPDGTRLNNLDIPLLMVTVGVDEDRRLIASHSASEIKAAVESGKAAVLKKYKDHKILPLHYVSDQNIAYFYDAEIPFAGQTELPWYGEAIDDNKHFIDASNYRGVYYTLPDPTSVENDKVLTVENGTPVWKDTARTLVVYTEFNGTEMAEASHSPTEIKAALDAGTNVVMHILYNGSIVPLELDYADGFQSIFMSDATNAMRNLIDIGENDRILLEVKVALPGKTTTVSTKVISSGGGVPGSTIDDNGKILQVVNGSAVWVSLADSAVKDYIDEYISSALEGDY